ncbi:hypothetical protein BAUCODRAFT_172013 [Baudoinia panamericana UAMH 10762]|uniref:Uncharacterized protein n=1 Tax=Baudoinia panamericana (strain UAMH 10762) TaxID=717646 RepID=M2N8P8_BAUPA|nr:uncharacterized protein BAUCODRAFT_172013 [Baudoinia panamericana UAMH 10762]EMD00499.1 hypothetical protein BAUCODRAFT_172013 [Baudoinia panamericana UAMH 10762]
MAVASPAGNPTPPSEEPSRSLYANYVPNDLTYNADFEDSLITTVLHGETGGRTPGIRVLPGNSMEMAEQGVSIRASDVSLQSLPFIPEHDLPLPLTDTRRIFASPLSGINLTHPGGYLEGGPGLDPEMDTFPDDFIANRPHIHTSVDLHRAIHEEVEKATELLRQRLRRREEARETNERVERELKTLMDEHKMEMRVHEKLAEEQARKKEIKEKRRRERDGG